MSACVYGSHIICVVVQRRAGLHMFMSPGTCLVVNLVHPCGETNAKCDNVSQSVNIIHVIGTLISQDAPLL